LKEIAVLGIVNHKYLGQRIDNGRERPAGPWEDVATVILSEITLVDQPERTEIEYRVIAVNKAGEGQAK